MRQILRKVFRTIKHWSLNKQEAELLFWTREIISYQQWYAGKIASLHNTKNPNLSEKIVAPNQKDASILTWHKLHQEKKYPYQYYSWSSELCTQCAHKKVFLKIFISYIPKRFVKVFSKRK